LFIVRAKQNQLLPRAAEFQEDETVDAVINERTDGDLTVDRTVTVNGLVTGGVRVLQGGLLSMNARADGNVIVEEGGSAVLRGRTDGDVINRGGDIRIFAAVRGCVRSESGALFIARDIIARGVRTDDEHPDGKAFS